MSAHAQTADATFMIGTTPTCVPFAQAVQQLGLTKPVGVFGFCQDPSVAKALGDFPKWYYVGPTLNANDPSSSPQVAVYRAVMEHYQPSANIQSSAPQMFAMILTDAKLFNQIGYSNLSPSSIMAAQRSFQGPAWMMAQHLQCGFLASKEAPSLCATVTFPYRYLGNGKWEDPTNGAGVDGRGLGL